MGYRPSTTDSYVHVFNRGTKKLPLFREESDLLRLMSNLYYFNTEHPLPPTWVRDVSRIGGMNSFVCPDHWESRNPLVAILAFTIMPNHFHILLKEKIDGGIGKFMHRVSMGYSKFINEKYDESGSLFEGTYKSRRVDSDADLNNLMTYIMIKNPFELYTGGLAIACKEFDSAYAHSLEYPLTSLGEYTGYRRSAILDHDLIQELFENPTSFKEVARDNMTHRLEQMESYDF